MRKALFLGLCTLSGVAIASSYNPLEVLPKFPKVAQVKPDETVTQNEDKSALEQTQPKILYEASVPTPVPTYQEPYDSFQTEARYRVENNGAVRTQGPDYNYYVEPIIVSPSFVDSGEPIYYSCVPTECCSQESSSKWPDWYIAADFIYWTVRQDNLAYASRTIVGTTTSPPIAGQAFSLDSHWEPGFKVEAGFLIPCSKSDLRAEYTWLHSKSSNSIESTSANLTPIFGLPSITGSVSFAAANWRLHYETLDLDLGTTLYFGKCFALHPFMGVRGAYIQEKLNVAYSNAFAPEIASANQRKQNFRGAGGQFGFDADWRLNGPLTLFGRGSFAILLGRNEIHSVDLLPFESDMPSSQIRNRFFTSRMVADIALGIGYDTCLNWCYIRNVGLSAAWEQHIWLNYSQVPFTVSSSGLPATRSGDLSLSGITIRAIATF